MSKNPEYIFNKKIESELKGFKTYLEKLGNKESTIRQKMNYTGYFLKWLESEHLEPENARYNDLLNLIDYCKQEEKSKKHINKILRCIRNFYEYLKRNHSNITNPAINLHLKGIIHKLPANIIDFTELEKLYQFFEPITTRDKRNGIILSLLIYQGITTEELHQLEPGNLKLKEGKIYIPGNRKRNSRKLELKSFQILDLYEYLNETRPKILDEICKPKPTGLACRSGRKPDKINKTKLENRLFISMNGSENIKSSLFHLFKTVQKINPDIRNAKQIRASVITYWLKNHNLRKVQYMAGHKYVSSTERYQFNNLDGLQSKVEKFHPLK